MKRLRILALISIAGAALSAPSNVAFTDLNQDGNQDIILVESADPMFGKYDDDDMPADHYFDLVVFLQGQHEEIGLTGGTHTSYVLTNTIWADVNNWKVPEIEITGEGRFTVSMALGGDSQPSIGLHFIYRDDALWLAGKTYEGWTRWAQNPKSFTCDDNYLTGKRHYSHYFLEQDDAVVDLEIQDIPKGAIAFEDVDSSALYNCEFLNNEESE